jgi:hypothetical protein
VGPFLFGRCDRVLGLRSAPTRQAVANLDDLAPFSAEFGALYLSVTISLITGRLQRLRLAFLAISDRRSGETLCIRARAIRR